MCCRRTRGDEASVVLCGPQGKPGVQISARHKKPQALPNLAAPVQDRKDRASQHQGPRRSARFLLCSGRPPGMGSRGDTGEDSSSPRKGTIATAVGRASSAWHRIGTRRDIR